MGHSHSTSSSSRDVSKQGSSHSPRKFQSYHLPFRKEKGGGLSKLKRSFFGKKKTTTNSGSYQQALSVIAGKGQRPAASTSLQNLPSASSANVQPMGPSNRRDPNGDTQFGTWSPRRPCCKPPMPLPTVEPPPAAADDDDFEEVELSPRNLAESRSLQDQDLQCYSKVIADAYSSVVKEKSEPKMVEPSRKASSSSEGKSSNSAFEDADSGAGEVGPPTETPPDADVPPGGPPKAAALLQPSHSGEDNDIFHEVAEKPAAEVRKDPPASAEEESDSSAEHFGSCGDGGTTDGSKSSDDGPWAEVGDEAGRERTEPSGESDVRSAKVSENAAAEETVEVVRPDSNLESREARAESDHPVVHDEGPDATVMPSTSTSAAIEKTTKQNGPATDDALAEVETEEPSVAEVEGHRCPAIEDSQPDEGTIGNGQLSEPDLQNSTTTRPLASVDVETFEAIGPSSTILRKADASSESPVIDLEEKGPIALPEKGTFDEPDPGAVPPEMTGSGSHLGEGASPSLPAAKRNSSSSDEKVSPSSSNCSASSIGDDIWDDDDDRQDAKSAEGIKTKLVLDLLTNLEVDMGDFQSFIELPESFEEKYQLLPFAEFLSSNLEMGISLDALGRCFRVLSKYGLNLLKPEAEELKFLKKVIIPPDLQSGHWLCVQGAKDVLQVFGYEERGNCLIFPAHEEPDVESTAAWVIEMLLAAHEISTHTLGTHPHPELFDKYLSEAGIERFAEDPGAKLHADPSKGMQLPASDAATDESSRTAPTNTVTDRQQTGRFV